MSFCSPDDGPSPVQWAGHCPSPVTAEAVHSNAHTNSSQHQDDKQLPLHPRQHESVSIALFS